MSLEVAIELILWLLDDRQKIGQAYLNFAHGAREGLWLRVYSP
jgi:hypothetical protein